MTRPVAALWRGIGIACPLLLAAVVSVLSACSRPPPSPPAPELRTVFDCRVMLIGATEESCREDVIGPGVLTIRIAPEPLEVSWEIAVRGLTALTESCEFRGSFDRTRLSGLQGRGAVELLCPIAPNVDRAYHELRFEHREALANRALIVNVRFEEPID